MNGTVCSGAERGLTARVTLLGANAGEKSAIIDASKCG